jgi:hypothetical protein
MHSKGEAGYMSQRYTSPEAVAAGAYPDIAVDALGNIHIVFVREDILYYKTFIASLQKWSDEQSTGIDTGPPKRISRSEPCIVVDSKNRPHVFAGWEYAYLDDGRWLTSTPKPGVSLRDTNLAIDRNDEVYLVHRGGNNGGNIGILRHSPGSEGWEALEDPDKGMMGKSNHVYGDLAISPANNSIHVVYRKGQPLNTAYRSSVDGGSHWVAEGIVDVGPESPHIVIDNYNIVYASDGFGNMFIRTDNGWISDGKPISLRTRMQPYLTADKSNQIYIGGWGGQYSIRVRGKWLEQRQVASVTGEPVGFMVMAGATDFAYAIWEESSTVDADTGAGKAVIVVGKISAEGITGIYRETHEANH